jgi:hypothetical protein
MVSRRIEITGLRFSRLTVVEFSHVKGTNAYWRCPCDCGREKVTSFHRLKTGEKKACGCLHKKPTPPLRHGTVYSPEYRVWQGMLARCGNRKQKAYAYYGGRGISVCFEWCLFEGHGAPSSA